MSNSTSVALYESRPAAAPPTTPAITVHRLMAAPAPPRVGPCILLQPRRALLGCRPALLLPGAAPPGCQPALLPLALGILPGSRPLLPLLCNGASPPRYSPGLRLPRATLPGGGLALLRLPRATVPRCVPALLQLLHGGPTEPAAALPQLLLGAQGQHPAISTAPAHLHTGVMGQSTKCTSRAFLQTQQWKGRQGMVMTGRAGRPWVACRVPVRAAALSCHVIASAALCQSTVFLTAEALHFAWHVHSRPPFALLDTDPSALSCYHLSLCVVQGQLRVPLAAGGIVGLVRTPALLGTGLQPHALHVPKHLTIRSPVCWLGGLLGRCHAENAVSQTLIAHTESHAKHARTSGNNKLACG